MKERVVVTGLGVVSSLGSCVSDFWKNLTRGESGISDISSFDTSKLERHRGGEVKHFNMSACVSGNVANLTRTQAFAVSASREALTDARIDQTKSVGLAMGSIAGGLECLETRPNSLRQYPVHMIASRVCDLLHLEGPAFTLSSACAAGNYAISLAYERVKSGEESVMLAGAADFFSLSMYLGFYRIFALAPSKCQPFDKNRRGLIPAEGAGMLVVESLASAKKRKAHIYAEILGYGMSADAYHLLIPYREGIFSCMENALETTGVDIRDLDYINAHGTGTIPNDKAECAAIKKLLGKKRYNKIPINSIKSMLGHAMGASSSLESISCCLTLQKGVIPPTINYETPDPDCDIDCVPNHARTQKINIAMNNSFGFGGMNCSIVFAAYGNS